MKEHITIVFAGDSITDAGRDYNNKFDLGKGYPNLVTSSLMLDYPGKITAYNSAYSGYRSSQILCRWECECLDYKPDFIVLLMGANDCGYELHSTNKACDKKFETAARLMFDDVKTDLDKGTKVLVLQPYVFDGVWAENRYDEVKELARAKREILQKLSEEYGFETVNLQEEFDKLTAEKNLPDLFWTKDGVHPTPAGHELIARIVLDTFNKLFK